MFSELTRDLVCHMAWNLDNAIDDISNWLHWCFIAAPDLRWKFDASPNTNRES